MTMQAQDLSSILALALERGSTPDKDSAPREVRFTVGGHSLVAVAGSGHAYMIAGSNRSATAVGRLDFSGTSYLIFEAKDAPTQHGPEAAPSAAEILTKRELQVALLIAEGKCDKEIARKLGISSYTVREHVRRTFAKLNVSRRSAIASCLLAGTARTKSG